MPSTQHAIPDPAQQEPPGRHRYKTPPGHRVIHVVVPEATFVHVHAQAALSGMRFSHYMARALSQLSPFEVPATKEVENPGRDHDENAR